MPSPTTFQATQHSTSNNDSNKPINSLALTSSHHHRPFTIGRGRTITTNTANNKNSRPIYGRRSKSYDTRLNAHVTNEERIPLDVKIRHDDAKYNQSSPLTSLKKRDRRDERSRSGSQEKDGARMRSAMSTTTTAATGKQHDDLEVCQESLSPDIGAVAGGNVNNDKDVKAQKSSKRRLSYHDNDNDVVNHHAMKTMSGHENKPSKKVKRRRMRLSDNENIRPNIHGNANNDEADQEKENDEEENLSFTDSIITHKDLHTSKSSKAQGRRHFTTALTVGESNTNTITIRSKANATTGNGNTHIRGSSQIKDLREFAKMNNGTAMQYKATYHTGSKPIHDKNLVGGTKNGSGGGGVNNNMIQPGQLIIKETSVTSKGNKGGNSYSFDQWKLPGSKRRDSSIYESTRPKLPSSILGGKSGGAAAAVLSTCAPYLIVDTALSKIDADRVRKFVRDGTVGQTPLEFFATYDKHDGDDDNRDDDEEDDDALPFDGSIVSDEEDEVGCKEEVERKVLGDRSNTTMGRKILKGKVLKQPSPHVKLSNTYHKGRTKSARKKRKSAQISPTESRKRQMVNDNVRFFVSEPNEEGCQKRFGLIEGVGGGCEEEGLSHLTPHRGRILELPGAVKSGQWETRIMKDGSNDGGSSICLRISLRHENSSLRPLENIVSGKDDAPDEHFVSIIKPEVTRKQSLVNHGILQDEELDDDEQISNNAFIGCVSLVLFDGFLSSSESVNLSSDVASTFLKNCVPSKELHIGCDLYGIVGNEHDSKDDETITGVLYPCNLSFDSDHIVLILCNEECQVCGIDIVFHPSKDWLRNHPLTEALLRDSHDTERSESEAGEIMRRYLEKNVAQVLKRPSPLLKHQVQSSRGSDANFEQSGAQTEQSHRNEDRSDSGTESIGFAGADQPDFDVDEDEFPVARDENKEEKALQRPETTQEESVEYNEEPTPLVKRICRLEEEKVKRLEEEKRTLAERIQHLEEEKRLEKVQRLEAEKHRLAQRVQHLEEEKRALAEQTTDKALVEPIERTANQSLVDNKMSNGSSQITQSAALRRNASAKKKKNAVPVQNLFGDTDSLFDELTNRNQQTKSDPTPKSKERFSVKDLFGESESLFGVGTKKRINRRKSTSDLPNPRTLSKKQDRARHSTGALTNNPQNCLGLAVPTKRLSRRTSATTSQTRHTIEPETVPTIHLSSRPHRSTTRKSKGMGAKKKKKVDVSELFGEESGLSVRTKTKKANKSSASTVPKESRGKLRFSTGTNATTSTAALTTSTAKKSMGTSRKAKMVDVSDLFEQDSGSLFGCSAKSRRFSSNRIAHDSQSISSIGGASCSFESLSTQSLNKVQVVSPVQPLFDVYYGKETCSQNDYNRSEGSVSSAHHFETQPFFDCFFGQESSGNCDDESTVYASQPLHSVYYGQYDNVSVVQSITSTFEVTTASPSLLYFGQEPTKEEEDDELTAYSVQPFYSVYYGHADEGSVTSSTLTASATSLQSAATTRRRYFHDYYYGQESSAVDAKDDDDATETSWRSGFAFAMKFIMIGVLPALIPMAVFISKQDTSTFSPQLDVYSLMEQSTTVSFWRLKPWE